MTTTTTNERMPVLFIGHGSPMNAIEDNAWSRGFDTLGNALPTPAAILAVSAHWYGTGTMLTSNEHPETIHDFGGFPRALFEVQYPARGSTDLAGHVVELLASRKARLSDGVGAGPRDVVGAASYSSRGGRAGGAAQHRSQAVASRPPRDWKGAGAAA